MKQYVAIVPLAIALALLAYACWVSKWMFPAWK